jgi:uncharacterized protein
MVTRRQIAACVEVAKNYGATRVLLFGSAAENPEEARDIDLICEGVKGFRFFEMAGMMEHASHVTVDVIPATPRTRFVEMNEKRAQVLYG